jgi:hypothetical protein
MCASFGCTLNGLVSIMMVRGIGGGSWGRNRLGETDDRLRRWVLGRRVVVRDALERSVVQLALLIAGEPSALPVLAHFCFESEGILG